MTVWHSVILEERQPNRMAQAWERIRKATAGDIVEIPADMWDQFRYRHVGRPPPAVEDGPPEGHFW